VSFEGRFTRFQEGRISPAPIQKPLPIWVAGRKEAAMKRAARYGDVWMPYMYSPQQLEQSRETIRRLAQAEGRDPSSIRTAIYLFTTVYDDEQQARRVAAETVGRNYQQDFNRLVDRYLLAGTPEQCRRRLAEYVAAGADRAILQLACPPEDYDTMLERVAAEIMPAFRRGA
ncbi:MAG TPA: LLM class flavin-dependent oxidoreductase, partial [Bacillota bacterium]